MQGVCAPCHRAVERGSADKVRHGGAKKQAAAGGEGERRRVETGCGPFFSSQRVSLEEKTGSRQKSRKNR